MNTLNDQKDFFICSCYSVLYFIKYFLYLLFFLCLWFLKGHFFLHFFGYRYKICFLKVSKACKFVREDNLFRMTNKINGPQVVYKETLHEFLNDFFLFNIFIFCFRIQFFALLSLIRLQILIYLHVRWLIRERFYFQTQQHYAGNILSVFIITNGFKCIFSSDVSNAFQTVKQANTHSLVLCCCCFCCIVFVFLSRWYRCHRIIIITHTARPSKHFHCWALECCCRCIIFPCILKWQLMTSS